MTSSTQSAPSSPRRSSPGEEASSPLAAQSSSASSLVLAGDRPTDVVAFESEMAAFFVNAAELLGVPKSVAVIYGILFASPEPLSFSEIEARVNFSKGSVSQGLRVLREVGAIKEAPNSPLSASGSPLPAPGSSLRTRGHQAFEPDMALRKLILRFIDQRLQTQLKTGGDRLERIHGSVPAGNEEAAKILRKRIKQLSGWHEQTRALLPIAKTFLKLS